MILAITPVHDHSLWLVGVAGLLCTAGAWATSRFFQRMTEARGLQRYAALLLTSLASGVTIWCTHFVAMLGFRPSVATTFSWLLTGVSLLIALLGSALGFVVAAGAGSGALARFRPALGGALLGLAVASMHYVGMHAVRMDGEVSWDPTRVAVSVVLAVVLASAALHAARSGTGRAADLMWALLTASVLLLHFTGMSALDVQPVTGLHGLHGLHDLPGTHGGAPIDREAQYVLAVAVAGMSFLTIGVSVIGYLLDGQSAAAASAERMRALAMSDQLTGLPNRASLNERLDRELEHARTEEHRLALMVIDLDDFKEINDLHGHPVGDEVLRVLGAEMAALAAREEGRFVARIGGDEFVALCRLVDGAHLLPCLDELRRALSVRVPIGEETIATRASIGAATYPDDALTAETLVNNADLAMYRAKADPTHDVCLYDPAVDERTRVRRGLTADLREAIAHGELSLHYQVQTAVSTGEALGYEALLRWQHPRLGSVSPADFIPLAEESGLIVPIGEWVLRTACVEAARWHPPHRVSVNVSAVQLADEDLVRTVESVLAETGLPAHRLELEMTETAVFTDRERALRTLREIKDLGVALALDDFGVGYSSLDALRTFPFDRIKIDRSFFSAESSLEQTSELVQTVLTLGRTFGMSVLAEGVETEEHLAVLTEAGCHEAQGYLFGRPASLDEIVRSGQLGLTT